MNIGFIGLGHMGLPMAINLIKAGHEVTGFDLQRDALATLTANQGVAAKSLQAAACSQDVILTMLQTGEQVQRVCFGEAGLFANARPGTLYIDCSSIDVAQSRAIHTKALEHELIAIDAPVSGGVVGATAATLTFMVGGTEKAYQACTPVLNCMGKTIIHAGDAGSGQAAKICNNMILGISMIAVSEAFVLATSLGLTAKKLFEVVTHSSGQCWVMDRYVPVPGVLENVPANRDYQAGFTAAMMLKDLYLSQNAANTLAIETPIASRATQLYQQLKDEGMSDLDFSAIIKLLGNKT
jgi:3-hydroxyisobutyrate dehydrogenase